MLENIVHIPPWTPSSVAWFPFWRYSGTSLEGRIYACIKCVYGNFLVQTSEAVPAPSQHQPLPKSLHRQKGHTDCPAAGEFLCNNVLGGLHHLLLHNPAMDIKPSLSGCPEARGQCLCNCQFFGVHWFWHKVNNLQHICSESIINF